MTFSVAGYQASTNEQLERLGGYGEDYFWASIHLDRTGRFHPYPSAEGTFTFRPPGYIGFLWGVLQAWKLTDEGGIPSAEESKRDRPFHDEQVEAFQKAVTWAQVGMLSLSALVLFVWLARLIPPLFAATLALVYGTNAYNVALTGFMHYEIVHMSLIVVSTWALHRAVEARRFRPLWLGVAGVCWGVTTLVRPMTLILPAFVLLMLYLRGRDLRRAVTATAAFAVGMVITIAPWTVRNYVRTGKLIPVNSQGSVAVWASTECPLEARPNHFRWHDLWREHALPIFRDVTGSRRYSYKLWIQENLALETRFRKEALQNLKRPWIYAGNVAGNAWTYAFDINSVLVRIYDGLNDDEEPKRLAPIKWFATNSPQNFHSPAGSNTFLWLYRLLMMLAVVGVISCIATRDRAAAVTAAVAGCFIVAHGITYMDTFYYYSKLPFMFVFAGFGLRATSRWSVPLSWAAQGLLVGLLVTLGAIVY